MANLYDIKESSKDVLRRRKAMGRRFFSMKEMAILKHDIAVRNSEVKRGEAKNGANQIIYLCNCGAPGCFIQHSTDEPRQFYIK
jgi:hypothetical protein